MNIRNCFLTAALLAVLAAAAPGQEGQGTVIRTLDQPFSIKLEETAIKSALDEISSRTGLAITLAEGTLGRLPHGEETRLRINAADVKLREALDAILTPMALEWDVRDMGILVRPCPELIRINRRPTFAETSILFALADNKVQRGKPFVVQAREATGVDTLQLAWHVGDANSHAAAIAAADGRVPCNGFQYLHRLCQGRGWTWYLSDTDIVILSEEMQAARQLGRTVSVRYHNQPLPAVLQDLARRADLGLKMDPGVLAYLSDQTRASFSLTINDFKIEDALQEISGATGLTFTTDKLNIRVGASELLQARGADKGKRPDFLVGTTVMDKDGTQYIVIFPPSELPDELVEKIRKLKAEKLAPATQPVATDKGTSASK